MTKKFTGLIAILVCHAAVSSSENATAASASQTKTQMPAAHPVPVTPPAPPKTNITQPVHKEFLLNMKMNSQGAVKGKSTRETSTPTNGAPVITTKIHPSSFTNKVDPSPLDQVGAPSLNGSSKDAAQMPVLKAFPPYSFDKFGVAGNASAASVNQPGEAGSAGNVILNSFGRRKLYTPPVWAPGTESPKEATTFLYGGLSPSPIGPAKASVLRVGGARVESVGVSNTITVSGARTEDVGNSSTIKIGAARTEKVSDSNTITVGGGSTESVSGSNRITTGATSAENVSGSNTKTVGGAMNENVGSSTGNAGQAKDVSDSDASKLQMEMDDRSKFLQTLSGVEKSLANSGNNVVKNMK